MDKKLKLSFIVPVLISFFVMSFCDMVGVSVDKIQNELNLGKGTIQLITSFVFIWFFFLSIPVGLLQDKYGKKNVLNIGILITIIGLVVPLFTNSFIVYLIGFAFLGIGNTIVQVSANPLLIDVVPQNKISAFMSFSQFLKSIGSLSFVFVASWCAYIAVPESFSSFTGKDNWKLLFVIYGVISIIVALWLYFIKIPETKNTVERATIKSALSLLGKPYILMMALGIFLVVGIDVGMNAVSGQYLQEKFKSAESFAVQGRTFYFGGKIIGTFIGALILTMFSSRKILIWTNVLGLLSIIAFFFAPTDIVARYILALIGFGFANVFPLIFSLTVEKYPTRTNEISGLMIMAISGGAAIPLLSGVMTDFISVSAGISIFVVCAVYLVLLSLFAAKKQQSA